MERREGRAEDQYEKGNEVFVLSRSERNFGAFWDQKYLQLEPIPAKAIVEFESGMALMVDERMRWEKAT